MDDDELILNVIKQDIKSVESVINHIMTKTDSTSLKLSVFDGRIFSCGKQNIDDFTITKKIGFFEDKTLGNYTLFNTKKSSILLCGRGTGYNESIITNIKPLLNLVDIILTEDTGDEMFMVNMSHEIRTPLNGVIGYSQLMNQTELTVQQNIYMKALSDCSVQLMKTINDILDISRLNSGKMGICDECFSIKEVIETITSISNYKTKSKKQKISFVIDNDVPSYIVMDKQKLLQIVLNLISNASKFSSIDSCIKVGFSNPEKNVLSFYVNDTGIGIHKDDIPKIFNSFSQTTVSTPEDGCGLGLAIVKKLCSLLDGNIDVTSELGVGSVFSCRVKYKEYTEMEKQISTNSKILENVSVLIVDDNVDNRILLTEELFNFGMKPISCSSAKEANSMILSNRYDFKIGIIDICMPDTNGIDLAKQIKEINHVLPLIALSSLDSFTNMSTDFVSKLDKPVNRLQLFSTLIKTIQKHTDINKNNNVVQTSSKTLIKNNECTTSPSSKFKKNARILIAEDISYNRTLLVTIVNQIGYNNVDVAENGKVAIEMIKTAKDKGIQYDILLLDIRMPEFDGYQVMSLMNEMNLVKPKIIVITASILQQEREKCEALGVSYFINKPIDINELKTMILYSSRELE